MLHEPCGQQIVREQYHALRRGLEVALGAETQGEVRPLSAKAGGCVPGCPDLEGGELGGGPGKGEKQKRETGRNHLFGVRKCSF